VPLLSGGMTYSTVACAAISIDHTENIIPLLLFMGHYLGMAIVVAYFMGVT
jgi:hypothetical protein